MSFALRCAVNVSAWPVHGGSSAEWEFLNSLLTPVRLVLDVASRPRLSRTTFLLL
jgi:hypothetical protein